ncbi:MAG: cytochrome c [Armatimonadetes bacterium]|nr:cytochrome c [Armatimonadota bacterium]
MKRSAQILALGGTALFMAGCHTDMWVQPKIRPQHESTFFADGASSRSLVEGTVARDHLRTDDALFTGRMNGNLVTQSPIKVTKEFLLRGQDRYKVFCVPCHGQLGDGQGMIAKRGLTLKRPIASYHTPRLREMPIGHFYDVMTNGYGAMYSYASRLEPQDRWAVAAYIRALQLSQNAPVDALKPETKTMLDSKVAPGKEMGGHEEGEH